MKVILLKNVQGLGRFGEVKDVADGHARNLLIPKGLAVPATDRNVSRVNDDKDLQESRKKKDIVRLQETARRLQGLNLEFTEKASPSGKLFAAVSPVRLSQELGRRGFTIGHRDIVPLQPMKEPGTYEVRVDLGQGLSATLRCTVRVSQV